jgi:prolyl-tRNA synthetase
MVMQHSDDKGLVLPPKVANTQVVIIPIPFKGK